MSWKQFVRRTRRVTLGGRKLGPLACGSHAYTVGPMTCLRVAQFLEAYGTLQARLGEGPLGLILERAPLGVVRLLLPVFIAEPVRAADLDRVRPEQVAAVAQALGETNDLEAIFRALTPQAGGDGTGLSLAALVCHVAKEYSRPPREVWLWPFAELLGVIEAEKELRPPSEGTQPVEGADLEDLKRRFEAYGYEVVE